MSAVSNRKWEYWINKSFFDKEFSDSGCFECILVPTLMTPQTVEFLSENFQIELNTMRQIARNTQQSVAVNMRSIDGQLCLKIRDVFHSNCDMDKLINSILGMIDAISICVDTSLECGRIDFISDHHGRIFSAMRCPFSRGMAFEVEERQSAYRKLLTDLMSYKSASPELKVAIQHYLTGMTLMGLEDQMSGMTDAAFMQFYQGCEAVCNSSNGKLRELCCYIAKSNDPDSRTLQIIAHHVYQVRHKYFGHGDVKHNFKAINSYDLAYQLTKQLLVIRYLCKRLIDMNAPSGVTLIREMRFYSQYGSEMFRGTAEELSSVFKIEYPGRTVKIYESSKKEIETYIID